MLEALPFTAWPEAVAQLKVLAQRVPELCPLPRETSALSSPVYTGLAEGDPGHGCAWQWQLSPSSVLGRAAPQEHVLRAWHSSIPTQQDPQIPLGCSCLQVQRATGIGNSRSILVTASDPNGFQLGASQDVRGQINFLTKDTGEPQPLQQLRARPARASQSSDCSCRGRMRAGHSGCACLGPFHQGPTPPFPLQVSTSSAWTTTKTTLA